jgi:hypothetical protein
MKKARRTGDGPSHGRKRPARDQAGYAIMMQAPCRATRFLGDLAPRRRLVGLRDSAVKGCRSTQGGLLERRRASHFESIDGTHSVVDWLICQSDHDALGFSQRVCMD